LKRAVLEKRLSGDRHGAPPPSRVRIPPRRQGEPLEFSPTQQRLWIVHQTDPDVGMHNLTSAFRLRGRFDVGLLERCVGELARRHESLRTTVAVDQGNAVPVVVPPRPIAVEHVDLRGVPLSEGKAEEQRAVESVLYRPFRLRESLPFRVGLIQTGEDSTVLLFAVHHLVSDGWSNALLLHELSALWSAYRGGRTPTLAEPTIAYWDYATWLRERLARGDLDKQLGYWVHRLTPSPPVLDLPTDRGRPSVPSFRGASVQFRLPGQLVSDLRQVGQAGGATLFMVLLAAYKALLYRHCHQTDLLVGTDVAGRRALDTENLVGNFVNTLPLRCTVSASFPFNALLRDVRRLCLEAFENDEIPFDRVVQAAQPRRTPGHPLLRTMFSLHRRTVPPFSLEGLAVAPYPLASRWSEFDLSLSLNEDADDIEGTFEYCTDLFDPGTIEGLSDRFVTLLRGIAARPGQPVADLPLLPAEELHRQTVEWNANAAEYPRGVAVPQLFEAQAARCPGATAAVCDGDSWSYDQLNRRANRIAHALAECGIGLEAPCCVLAERGLEILAAMLGVFKAGGVYVPLEPQHPPRRLGECIALVGCRTVIAAPQFSEVLSQALGPLDPGDRPKVLFLPELWSFPGEGNLPQRPSAHNLAYVIFTSGSTGSPKAAAIEHGGMTNHVFAKVRDLRLSEGDVVAQTASQGFDISVWQYLSALLVGGAVRVYPDGVARDPALLLAQVDQDAVTVFEIVPALLRALFEVEPAPTLARLRWLIATGEALPSEVCRRWMARYPHVPLLNAYGPTECSDDVTHHLVAEPPVGDGPAPLGRPLQNTQAYILDGGLTPVPIGALGELYIGGDGVGRGYIGRPDLTARAFVPDPFSGHPGARLYRTGDLARYRDDGTIEFHGRLDHQIKIRGHRIEPEEIAAQLERHPGVRQAAVCQQPAAGSSEAQLAAYVVPEPTRQPTAWELREFARQQLPEHMVPVLFAFLEALPLTRNGKLDVAALPEAAPVVHAQYRAVPPLTAIEETLVGIWEEVLGRPVVGVSQNFFELGGHSLLATQVTTRVRSAFDVELPLRDFLQDPTVKGLADQVRLLRQTALSHVAVPVEALPRGGHTPLSFAQQRLWFLQQLRPSSAEYNMSEALRFEGDLDNRALARSLQELARRHEAFRTVFRDRGGKPEQVILPDQDVPVVHIDLGEHGETDREVAVERLGLAEAARSFDLSRGPLLRVTLLRLGPRHHVLLVCMHHIIADGWSVQIFVRELVHLYTAFATGGPVRLRDLPYRYAEFAAWQRRWLDTGVLDRQLHYWVSQLRDVPVLQLPTDRPRPAVQTFRGAHETTFLPRELREGLEALARREGATLFMLLLAAFEVVLARYSGQHDIAVASPIANRTRQEFEGVIGFFVNTLILRCRLVGNPRFVDFLHHVRAVALEAYAHQDLPFERLVDELGVKRDLSHQPLFQVMFVLQNAPGQEAELPGLRLRRVDLPSSTAKFDFTFFLWEEDGGLLAWLEYSAELFDRATVVRLLKHFQKVLESVLVEPGLPVWEVPLMDEAETRLLLREWNRTHRALGECPCIHQLVEREAVRNPGGLALAFEGENLTYRALNRQANAVARMLRQQGVGPDVLVGIFMERSFEQAVALLGVLKAGGAVVALDLAYPEERLCHVIQDAAVPVILTQDHLSHRLPAGSHRPVSLRLRPDLGDDLDANPAVDVSLDNLVYAIYTSGTTGLPKGVGVTHRAFANLLAWQREESGLADGARTLQFSAFGFCVSFQEFLTTWCAGATLVLIPDAARRDVESLWNCLERERIERLHLPFAALKQLAELCVTKGKVPSQLREVVTAGEPLQLTAAIRKFVRGFGGALHNQYGASETHVVSAQVLRGDPATWPELAPVGRPISNVRLYVLDRFLQPTPVGVPGELYAGGACLPRGYVNDPGLTALKLIPDPFAGEPGERLYRTGDLARYVPDGTIVVLGRADQQVKIRGFRVEPGEVESALRQVPGVRDAAVVPFSGAQGDRRLAAYLVLRDEPAHPPDDLPGQLRRRLPEYMLPSAYVFLDALPVNANGKLDVTALPPPRACAEPPACYVAPRTQVESVVASIWSQVLGVEKVGALHSFFDLGGHSLLATQVVSRLRDAFRREIPLRLLFEIPVLADLAREVERALLTQQTPSPPPITRADHAAGLQPLSFAQRRLWFLDRLEPGAPGYVVQGAVRLRGSLETGALGRALREIARRQEVLCATFREVDGRPFQVISQEAAPILEAVDLEGLPDGEREAEAKRLSAHEARRPFDLEAGPLLRTHLFRLRPGDHVLLVTTHHIVSDGWSMNLLVGELAALYEAFCQGKPCPLPDLPIQYADFASWQQRWLTGGVLEAHLVYWRGRLGSDLPSLQLPTDRPRPPRPAGGVARVDFSTDPQTCDALLAIARQEGATLFMVLLAAFKILLARYAGQEDVIVGTPIAGRTRTEVEGLVGFFVNMLPLRGRVAPAQEFRAFLAEVRASTLEAYAHQEMPFEKLVEELSPVRDTSRTPVFQAVFVLQNVRPQRLEVAGLETEPFPTQTDNPRYDLILEMEEESGRLVGGLTYRDDLFEEGTARSLAGHYDTLLRGIAADPGRRVGDLPLLTEFERQTAVVSWNRTETPYASRAPVHRLIDEWAADHPEAVAVLCGGRQVSYRELTCRADQIGSRLRAEGVRGGQFVALLAPRSLDLPAAILGILKAGAAYLPIDPTLPAERIQVILSDARPTAVLLEPSLAHLLPSGPSRMFFLGDGYADGPDHSSEPAGEGPIAYMIYTSGSTGRPHGVVVSHANLLHVVHSHRAYYKKRVERFLLFPPVAFDSSVVGLFWTLCDGGAVVLPLDQQQKDVHALALLVEQHRVTHWLSVPSAYAALLEEAPAGSLRSLSTVIVAGEECKPEVVARHLRALPGVPLFNEYGPTEAAVWCMAQECVDASAPCVPIGRPIANARVYVLSPSMEPAPVGVAGEVYVGGAGVTWGYHNLPDVTAARFVPDPFAPDLGARLYRTGDVARYRPTGEIEFLGRRDHQVKVRGQRVQLEEVEAQLASHPSVRQCAAATFDDPSLGTRLVGYVVAAAPLNPKELRAHLKARLPEPMVPAAFLFVDHLPLSPNGKLDRAALPPVRQDSASDPARVLPMTRTEQDLAAIWCDVLGRSEVGVDHDFFELGGHSLLATRVMARIEAAFGVRLPIYRLFESSSLAALAADIDRALGENAPTPGAALRVVTEAPQPGGPPFFCVVAAGEDEEVLRQIAASLPADQAVYGLVADGLDTKPDVLVDVEAFAADFLREIRNAQRDGPYYLGGIGVAGLIALELADRLTAQGEEAALLAVLRLEAGDPDMEAVPGVKLSELVRNAGATLLQADDRAELSSALAQVLAQARRTPQFRGADTPGKHGRSGRGGWHCPHCRAPLHGAAGGLEVACPGCGREFPFANQIPVLLRDPEGHLRRSLAAADAYLRETEDTLSFLDLIEQDDDLAYRRPFARRVRPALLDNFALARSQAAAIRAAIEGCSRTPTPQSPPVAPAEGQHPAAAFYGLRNLGYLRVDWAGTPEGERQIAAVLAALGGQLSRYCDPAGSAVVPGAGTGRYLYEIAGHFDEVIGLDDCFCYAHLFRRIREEPVPFAELHLYMPVGGETAVSRHLARFAGDHARLDKVRYALADARRMPLADGSQSAVISIYFTDTVTAEGLLREAHRVLRPGGRFIHYGPLGYGFVDPRALLMPEELLELAARIGFTLEEQDWLELAFQEAAGCGLKETHRVWSFVLTKR
jgi:amino acid adenylation domain-containing protein